MIIVLCTVIPAFIVIVVLAKVIYVCHKKRKESKLRTDNPTNKTEKIDIEINNKSNPEKNDNSHNEKDFDTVVKPDDIILIEH